MMHPRFTDRLLFSRVIPTILALTIGTISTDVSARNPPMRYTTKFICGEGDDQVLGIGNYFTAINVHNGTPAEAEIRKMFTVGLPGEKAAGHTDFSEDFVTLKADDTFEIDCPEIRKRAEELCRSELCKGFVVLESSTDLEVVTVYTAADANSKQVTTLHTDRVTPKCPVRTQTIPGQSIRFSPLGVGGGDRDFNGNGPCVDFRLALELEDGDRTLAAKYYMNAYECAEEFYLPMYDYTSAYGSGESVLVVAGPRGRILGHNMSTRVEHRYVDTNHLEDREDFPAPSPVERLVFVGDTAGDDAGIKTGVLITLRPMEVTLESCDPPEYGTMVGTEDSVCGNGITEPGEECDDGNTIDNDACTNLCKDHLY